MNDTVKALKSRYALFIVSIICIIAAQVVLEYWFDQESMFSLILSAIAILIIILAFVYIFLPSLHRLRAVNRKLLLMSKSLEDRERQYRELVEGATDVIYELDGNGEFSFVNELMLRMSEYTRDELIGKSYLDLIHPDDRAYAARFYRDQLKSGRETSYLEFRMLSKRGRAAWIGQNVRYFYEGTWVTHVRVVARDITEGRQAQLALQKLKEEAEQTTRAKSQFLSMMSHEIRTPMNAIIGLTNLLADSPLTQEQQANVQLLKFSGDNLLTIINDILDFSKIEAQKIELEQIDFDIRKIVDQTIRIHAPKASEKKIKLTCRLDEQLPAYVKGDPVRFIQIITNLLTNAIKFTREGNVTVRIDTRKIEGDVVDLALVVSDSGIGIAPDKLGTIFESFSQAEDATTRKYGGTGLGLAITRKLVELMGGHIEVHSTPGEGAEFRVALRFPIGTEPAVQPEEEIQNDHVKADAHILLAEDNTMNQLVVISFLHKWNIRSSIAVNGREALTLVSTKKFDLVLMDLQMPEMSGYEVAERIRAMDDAYYKHIPIIALTASAMVEVKDKVLASGMNDFISKPFQPQHLKRVLAKYIPAAELPLTEAVDSDEALAHDLLQPAIDNLEELQRALTQAIETGTPGVFRAAAHKCKMTLSYLDNAGLTHAITSLQTIFAAGENPPGVAVNAAREALADAIRSLHDRLHPHG